MHKTLLAVISTFPNNNNHDYDNNIITVLYSMIITMVILSMIMIMLSAALHLQEIRVPFSAHTEGAFRSFLQS